MDDEVVHVLVIVQVMAQIMEVECASAFVGCVLETLLWFQKWIAYVRHTMSVTAQLTFEPRHGQQTLVGYDWRPIVRNLAMVAAKYQRVVPVCGFAPFHPRLHHQCRGTTCLHVIVSQYMTNKERTRIQ